MALDQNCFVLRGNKMKFVDEINFAWFLAPETSTKMSILVAKTRRLLVLDHEVSAYNIFAPFWDHFGSPKASRMGGPPPSKFSTWRLAPLFNILRTVLGASPTPLAMRLVAFRLRFRCFSLCCAGVQLLVPYSFG